MKWRLFLIVGLVGLRLLGCWLSVLEYLEGEKVRIFGKAVIMEQSYNKCISRVGAFQINWSKKCSFEQGENLTVVGRVKASLIERVLGQVNLVDPVIIKQDIVKETVKKRVNYLTRVIEEWRQKMIEKTIIQLPEPEAGLTLGVVLGVKTDLEQKFYEELVKSGTIHIVVASGYNLMIVGSMALSGALLLLSRKWASLMAIVIMFSYAAIAGNEPPVIRASIMGSLIFLGTAWGRRSVSWWSLMLAGSLMILIDPVIVASVSFQLSMAASVGLMVVAPRFTNLFYGRRENENFSRGLLMKTELTTTLATMAMTTPIIWWHFGRLQWVAILSNLLILPLVPLLMGVGGVATLVGFISTDLARPFYWGVWVLSRTIVELVQAFGT